MSNWIKYLKKEWLPWNRKITLSFKESSKNRKAINQIKTKKSMERKFTQSVSRGL